MTKLINIKICNKLMIAILLCLALLGLYRESNKHEYNAGLFHYLLHIAQFIGDAGVITCFYISFRYIDNKVSRRFYLILFIGIGLGLAVNESRNVYSYIVGFNNVSININYVLSIFYFLFVIIQIYAWSYILRYIDKEATCKTNGWLGNLINSQLSIVIFLLLIVVLIFHKQDIVQIGFCNGINTILDLVLLSIMANCLVLVKGKKIICINIGLQMIVVVNMVHGLNHFDPMYCKVLDLIRIISLSTMFYGVFVSLKHKDEPIQFYAKDSIHVVSCRKIIFLKLIIILLFTAAETYFLSKGADNVILMIPLVNDFACAFIFIYLVSLIVAKLMAISIVAPLSNISTMVDLAYSEKGIFEGRSNQQFKIQEIGKCEKHITESIAKLQVSNREKADFLMNISHDFRTPASGIYHISQSIQNKADDPKLKEMHQLVVDASEQLLHSFDGIMDYSRIEAGVLKPRVERFCINQLVNDVFKLLSAKAIEKKINLTSNSLMFYLVTGDRNIVYRVLLNLISNAIKFTNEGEVRVKVNECDIDGKTWLLLHVKDTGIGIDESQLGLIFKPFYQIKDVYGSSSIGVGLGLSNVDKLLRKIGGKITVNSKVGIGSNFIVHLPRVG